MDELEVIRKRLNRMDENDTWKYLSSIKWKIATFHLVLHFGFIYGCYLIMAMKVQLLTLFWESHVLLIAGIGTGIGAHRFFAHRSFKATRPLKLFLLFGQILSGEASVLHWVQNHRCHHKYVDTNKDPANINRGFFFAYVGNYFLPRHPECLEVWDKVDMSDITSDKDLMFQYKHFNVIWVLITMTLPTIIPCIFWNESLWIAFWMNLFRYAINFSHLNFSNSINHLFGNRPYDKNISATENMFMVLWTIGEGYHNFHHTFPLDYKSSEFEGWEYFNISTTLIQWAEKFGLAYDLKTTPKELIANRVKRTGDGSHVSTLKID